MILISDSGSTKAEWVILSEKGVHETLFTTGINPFYQDTADIVHHLKVEYTSEQHKFDAIYFYGAGCTNSEKSEIVKSALNQFFDCGKIHVGSDLLAAARSLCQDKPGVACILGTGSNSCYYDGEKIIDQVSPLGFILGDEGSGAVLGKKLVGDILKKQLPQKFIDDFFETYQITPSEILDNVYKMPFPSRYLARYTRFLSKNIDHPEIENIVIQGFREFITRNLLQYHEIGQNPIHFAGSIAFHFDAQLRKAIRESSLRLGKIEQAPMNGLIAYHKMNLNNTTN